MIANLRRLTAAFAGAFAITALALGYWGLIRSEALLARDDNPRRVEAELAIQRGQIVDRSGIPLALSKLDENGDLVREYPQTGVGPVVGYYSLRHGVGGVEAAYDDVLRGDAFLTPVRVATNRWLHRDQTGGDVRLTINLPLQQAAEAALAGQRGALVVVDVPSGEILALTSSPTYEPAMLDEEWEALREDESAPLVNRVTQGLYPPGAALQSVLLGAGLNANVVDLDQPLDGGELAVPVDGATLDCGLTPIATLRTLRDAYRWACPAPFLPVGESLGRERLEGALTDFGLGLDPPLGLRPELVAETELPADATLRDLTLGQGDLAVTPLQMVLVVAAVANHGEAPALRLADAVRAPGGAWQPLEVRGHPRAAISRASAETLADAMRQAVRSGAAHEAALPGVAVSGHAGLSLSGETQNAWFVGFAPNGEGRWLAIAVLVEDAEDAGAAARIGSEALGAALDTDG